MPSYYLGLGANQGDRAAHLRAAVAWLAGVLDAAPLACSPVYATAPLYVTAQPEFLNLVVAGAARDLAPADLLARLLAFEAAQGRDRRPDAPRYGPRPIDLDILLAFADDQRRQPIIVATPDLVIPHPRLAERAFVLRPLRDLAPDLAHPTLGVTIADLAARVADQDARPLGSLADLPGDEQAAARRAC